MQKKSKIFDILETIFYITFAIAIIGFFIYGFILLGLVKSLLIICPITAIIILIIISIKKDDKKKKEYSDKYISKIIIEDKYFGDMKFEKDSAINQLLCRDFNIKFGDSNPKIEIEDYDEKNNDIYFRSLEFAFEKHSEITENLVTAFLEEYSDFEETTPEELKDDIDIVSIKIIKRDEYFLEGSNFIRGEDISEGDPEDSIIEIVSNPDKKNIFKKSYMSVPTAYIECKSRKMCFTMEE